MIHEVDESLRLLMRKEALQGADIDILFETPTKDWASRRNTPTIDVFLYDIREDIGRREEGVIDVRGEDGKVVSRRRPPRYYKLSYLVTAWTQRPEDEHRLLSACMATFLKHGELPKETLVGSLKELNMLIMVNIALPPPQDRSISDIWTALGGELKPSLELVVVAPLETYFPIHVGPPLTEPPIFGVRRATGPVLERSRPQMPGVPPRPEPAGSGGKAQPAGSGGKAQPAGSGGKAQPAASGGKAEPAGKAQPAGKKGKKVKVAAGAAAVEGSADPNADPLPEETLAMGEDETGRVFRMQGLPRKRF